MINGKESKILTDVTIKTWLPKQNALPSERPRRLVKLFRSRDVCITSKAALITLIWSFCIGIVYGLAGNSGKLFTKWQEYILFGTSLGNAMSLCLYPLAGYLADNVFGSYKIITNSLKMFVIACILAPVPIAVFLSLFTISDRKRKCDLSQLGTGEQNIACDVGLIGIIGVSVLFYTAIKVSSFGFNANVIQFGMDQLHNSPAEHQSLFIYWYVWIYYLILFPVYRTFVSIARHEMFLS